MIGPQQGLSTTDSSTESNVKRGVATGVSDSARTLRIAFLGNSMLYFNDCPRLLAQMISVNQRVEQDSCLRPNASLSSLWDDGNGMHDKFRSPAAMLPDGRSFDIGSPSVSTLLSSRSWDFVVLNDHSQAPLRRESNENTMRALRSCYATLVGSSHVVFLQTAAYREPVINNSGDLGDFEEFEAGLFSGYMEYKHCLETLGISNVKVAPFGRAVRCVKHQNLLLWKTLYGQDGYHPSPHGTWLMACVLHCTILGVPAPSYHPDWWNTCRYLEEPRLSLPTVEEAQYLSSIACLVCKVPGESAL
jgi:hypothetical protein